MTRTIAAAALGICLLAPSAASAALIGLLEQVSPPPATSYLLAIDFSPMVNSSLGDVTARVQPVDIGPDSGCQAADFAGFVPGSIALLQRGTCTFELKAINAYSAGASAVIIFNSFPGLFTGSLGPGGSFIPVVSVTDALGLQFAFTPGLVMRVAVTDSTLDVPPVPEPMALALLGLGLAAVAARRRRA
jgi:hypothetical protein